MTEMDLLSAMISHFEPRVQQGLICVNFQNTQNALAFLAKYQGLGESRESFRSPRRDYDRRDVSRRKQDNPNRDERQRDRRSNVNVRHIQRQTEIDLAVDTIVDIKIIKTDGTLMDARRRE
jgi:hypothetical protein